MSGTTLVSRHQSGFTGGRDSEWQWHQLGHMQICTLTQIYNHASIPPLSFFISQMPFLPPNQQHQSTINNCTEGNVLMLPCENETAWHNWNATMHQSRFHRTRHIATKLIRPQSSGLCHLICHSATCVWEWDQGHDIDELQQHLLHVWHDLEQSLINSVVDQWPTHLSDCVHANGRHFEHTLSLSICFLYIWYILCFTTLDAAGNILRLHYKSINVMFHFHQVA